MTIGDVISTTTISTGKWKGRITKEIVVKTFIGRIKGKPKYASQTKHIIE